MQFKDRRKDIWQFSIFNNYGYVFVGTDLFFVFFFLSSFDAKLVDSSKVMVRSYSIWMCLCGFHKEHHWKRQRCKVTQKKSYLDPFVTFKGYFEDMSLNFCYHLSHTFLGAFIKCPNSSEFNFKDKIKHECNKVGDMT